MIAFWRYSSFPYCLSAKLVDVTKGGKVVVEGYPGFEFKPIQMLSDDIGQSIQERINNLDNEYHAELNQLKKKYKKRLKKIAPFVA